jgi:hypothetical protein
MEKLDGKIGQENPLEAKTCVTCPHWYFRDDLSKNGNLVGDCRLKPAALYMVPGLVQGSIAMQTIFPPHGSTAWCGEHPERKSEMTAIAIRQAIDKNPEIVRRLVQLLSP